MKSYKTPILSSVFYFLGSLVLLGALLWVVVGIILAGETRSALPLLPAIGVALALVFAALIYFGVAQAIEYLGRTAHSTNRLCTLIETTLGQRIQSIEQRLSSATPILVRMDNISTAAPSSGARGGAVYHYSTDGTLEGPFTATELKKFRSDGVITDDTQVFREGDSQWRAYREFPDFVRR